MNLELHDAETGTTLFARVPNIDFDYQAEIYVLETSQDARCRSVVRWVLLDEQGTRCVWERPAGAPDAPRITLRSDRYAGEWKDEPADETAAFAT